MSTKRIVIGLGVVLALALGVAFYRGAVPPKHGLEGTIGAAKRYQTEQMNASDVSLSDPDIQDLLQSDLFHQLATDASFRVMFRTNSEAFRTMLMSPEYRDIASKQGFAALISSDLYQRAVETNNLALLRNAKASDFQRTRQMSEAVERVNSLASHQDLQKAAKEAAVRAVLAREQASNAALTLDRTVNNFLKTQAEAGKSPLLARVSAEQARAVQARTEANRLDLAYQNAALALSKVTDDATRKTAMQKIENTQSLAVQARQLAETSRAAYNMSVADFSKTLNQATSKELLARVDAQKISAAQAQQDYSRTMLSLERTVAAVASPDAEKTQATTLGAYAQALELSHSTEFARAFANANFRTVSGSVNFARLAQLDAFRQVSNMEAFQKMASNRVAWQAIASADAERASTVK